MQYMTIVQELIQANSSLHEELRSKRLVLDAIKSYAIRLRTRHLELAETMDRHSAFEIALSETEAALSPSEFNLDDAIAFIRSQPA